MRPPSGTTLAFAAFLNRRTGHRAIGAEHAAIAGQRLELLSATSADIKELAGIGRHWLGRLKPALRAGQNGFQLHCLFRISSFDQADSRYHKYWSAIGPEGHGQGTG